MRTGTILAASVLVAAAATAQAPPAQAAQAAPDKAEIAGLVEKLGSKDFRQREAANAALKAFGTKALPALAAALAECKVPETQRRLEVMVEKLKAEQLVAPSRVTYTAANKPLKTVLKDLCKQAGYMFNDNAGLDQRVSLDVKDATLWEAIELATAGSGVVASFRDDDPPSLYAYRYNAVNPYVECAGPFRFTASHINCNRNLQLANIPLRGEGRNQQENLNLTIQLAGEPKTQVVGVGTTTLDKAVDDCGASLALQANNGYRETRYYSGNSYRSLNQSFYVNLSRGDRKATTITEISGKVSLQLLREIRPEIEIEKVLEPGKKKAAGSKLELELEELDEANGGYTAKFTFRLRQGDGTGSDYGWWGNAYQRLELHDDKGNKFRPNGLQEQNVSNGSVSMRMDFTPPAGAKMGKAAKLVLVEWVTTERTFPFKFKNIPLP